MSNTKRTKIDDEFRTCTKCNQTFPNTNEYFGWASKSKGRLNAVCKTCTSQINKEKNRKIIESNKNKSLFYDGTKPCIRCGRELPNNKLFFPIDLACKSGLRNVCRECSPKEAGFLDENYKVPEKWTEEELELLKSVYNHYTGLEIIDKGFFPNRTLIAIESQASILGIGFKTKEARQRSYNHQAELVSEIFKGRDLGQEWRDKISATKKKYYETHDSWWKGRKRSKENCELISKRAKERGQWKGENNPRHINPLNGELNGRWKGGILDTYLELRSETKEWFNESIEFCGYKCVITGGEFDNVHHTTAFRDIVDEVFELTKIEVRPKVCDYPVEEFDELRSTLKDLHTLYGFGACINKDIHKLFHDNYGYTKFSPYDFLDFIYRLDCGEFDSWLLENNIKLDINYEYIDYLESTLLLLESA
jgi:hypothetical protein